MSMDLDTLNGIASDLATLSRHETLEVIEGRIPERHVELIGSAKAIAESYRAAAKQRLEVIAHGLQTVQKGSGDDYTSIQNCIHQLDTFIASQQEAAA